MSDSTFFSICYHPIAEFLGDIEASLVLQHLDYWLKNPNCGYKLADGCKWIYNGYRRFAEQLPNLSEFKIGRLIRKMEALGWVISEHYHNLKKNIGFIGSPPQGWQEYNQKKWYRLDYQKIFLDTGFDLLSKGAGGVKSSEPPASPSNNTKPSQQANMQDCTNQSTDLYDASCKSVQSSVYIENPYISQNKESEKEKKLTNINEFEIEDNKKVEQKCQNPYPSSNQESSNDSEELHRGKNSEGSSQVRENRTKLNQNDNKQILEDTQQEIWEIAPGSPYPTFINWRAQMHYRPQGGKWETGARSYAHSEFYNNKQRTTSVLFPEFMQYMKNVSFTCNQQLANGSRAILPSLFIPLPEPTLENVRQLMVNFEQLVERGVEVALPNSATTPSNQSSPYTVATASLKIKPLESLIPALPQKGESPQGMSMLDLVMQKQSVWRNIPTLRVKISEWAKTHVDVMIIDDYGPVLGCPLKESHD
jgi:hypothetical protein